jgi:hypothetical protein
MSQLQDQLAKATDDKQKAEILAKIEEEKRKADELKKGSSGGPRPGGAAAPGGAAKPPCKCAAGDPLCSCL